MITLLPLPWYHLHPSPWSPLLIRRDREQILIGGVCGGGIRKMNSILLLCSQAGAQNLPEPPAPPCGDSEGPAHLLYCHDPPHSGPRCSVYALRSQRPYQSLPCLTPPKPHSTSMLELVHTSTHTQTLQNPSDRNIPHVPKTKVAFFPKWVSFYI